MPPVGALEAPGTRLLGAGIGAALDAEQLRFDQLARDRRAVDRDEGLIGTRPVLVQPAREHLLAGAGAGAGAGFAEQQHGDPRRCGLREQRARR